MEIGTDISYASGFLSFTNLGTNVKRYGVDMGQVTCEDCHDV